MIDTENPVTGALNVYNKSEDGTLLGSLTDTTENTEVKWVNNVEGIFFNVTGGSDNSTQWWHRFSLDGGTTWYDYVSTSELVKVFEDEDQGQVSIMVQSYDNREKDATGTLNSGQIKTLQITYLKIPLLSLLDLMKVQLVMD